MKYNSLADQYGKAKGDLEKSEAERERLK